MLFSGIVLVGLMKKDKGVLQNKQRKWNSLHVNKFMLSLLMTPFCDRVAYLILVGGSTQRGVEAPEMPEAWSCILAQFKFGVMIGLLFYSAHVRKYREDNDNFTD